MSSVLKFFKSDKKKKSSGHYLEIAEIGMPTQVWSSKTAQTKFYEKHPSDVHTVRSFFFSSFT